MKKIKLLSILMLVVMALPFMISCSKDDDESNNGGSSGGSNIMVVVNENGTTSNGSIFSAIDDKNFYLDYIKYTVENDHLVVTGYDKAGFKGVANIVSRITYKGYTYEVLRIKAYAFEDSKTLTSVIMPNSVIKMGEGAFSGCKRLSSISMSNRLTYISDLAFHGCSALTSVTIPNSVTSIGERAFQWTNLISVTIGSGVKSLGGGAFYDCNGLIEIHCLSPTPPGSSAYLSFDEDTYDGTLYVPKGSIEAYRESSSCHYFRNIVEE